MVTCILNFLSNVEEAMKQVDTLHEIDNALTLQYEYMTITPPSKSNFIKILIICQTLPRLHFHLILLSSFHNPCFLSYVLHSAEDN